MRVAKLKLKILNLVGIFATITFGRRCRSQLSKPTQEPIEQWNLRMNFRIAQPSDAPILAAISIEVWLGTYIRRGVNAFFADYALNEFTSDKLRALLEDQNEHFIVSENEDGLDGFIRVSHEKVAPVASCSSMEI